MQQRYGRGDDKIEEMKLQYEPHVIYDENDDDNLSLLPIEIQLEIIAQLPYPDALALKLTCHHFQTLTTPYLTVASRVHWLLERAQANLPIPKTGQLQLRNDAVFLQNKEIQRILKARRRHEECRERGAGCLIVPRSMVHERVVKFWESETGRRKISTYFARRFCYSEGLVPGRGDTMATAADRTLAWQARDGVSWPFWRPSLLVLGVYVLFLAILLANKRFS